MASWKELDIHLEGRRDRLIYLGEAKCGNDNSDYRRDKYLEINRRYDGRQAHIAETQKKCCLLMCDHGMHGWLRDDDTDREEQ